MSFTPSPEDEEPRSGFTLRMEFDRREDRCFYCHNCNAPFSIGHLTTDDVACPTCSETFVEELFDDQATTPESGGRSGEFSFEQPSPRGLEEAQRGRIQAQQEVRLPTQSQEDGTVVSPPPAGSSGGEGGDQAVVDGIGSIPSDEATHSGREEGVGEEGMEYNSVEQERQMERERQRQRERERERERRREREREMEREFWRRRERERRPYQGGYIRATFTRPGADTDRDHERDRDPFFDDDDPFMDRDRMRRLRMMRDRDRFSDRDRDMERDRNGRPRMVIRMTTHGGAQMTIVADTSSGQDNEESGTEENAERLRRENTGMLQLMQTLISSFGSSEADEERERQQRQQEEEDVAGMPPEEQAQRQAMDEMLQIGAGIPPWARRRHFIRRSQGPTAGDPRNYAWGARGLDDIITWLQNTMGDGGGSPPADKSKVEKLPKRSVSDQEAGQQCSVCQEVYMVTEELVFLPCSHCYHSECILPWLDLHDTCPTCRYSINKGEMPPDVTPSTAAGSSSSGATQTGTSEVRAMDSASSIAPEEPTSASGSSVNPESGTGNESL